MFLRGRPPSVRNQLILMIKTQLPERNLMSLSLTKFNFGKWWCGGLKEKAPDRLIGRVTNRRCGLVGIGGALLEKMHH